MAKIGYGANTIGVSKLYKLHELKRFFKQTLDVLRGQLASFRGRTSFFRLATRATVKPLAGCSVQR
jgi:hypothetical protein